MWGIKATTIPVVIGIMVLIKKGLGKYVQQIAGNIKMHELQKITLRGTSHILRKAVSPSNRLLPHSTLGSRNGLGYSVVLWYSIEKDNNNNNNNNNDNNNNINISTTTTTTNNNNNSSSSSSSSINKIM